MLRPVFPSLAFPFPPWSLLRDIYSIQHYGKSGFASRLNAQIGTTTVEVVIGARARAYDLIAPRDTRGSAEMEGRNGVPVYDFVCEPCGPFEQRRSFAEASDPAICPSCGKEARRVYSMPSTRRMPVGLSRAMDRSEKSAYEPEVVRRPVGSAASGHKHSHSHGRP